MSWDESVVRWATSFSGRWAFPDAVMFQIAEGWVPILVVVLVVAFWIWRERRLGLYAVLALGVGIGVSDFLGAQIKDLVARPRPCRALEQDWVGITGCGVAFSMPSNHAMNMAAAAAFLQVLYPKTGWIMWPVVGFVAFSRLYIAAHYPTDLLVGVVLGTAIGLVAGFLFRRFVTANPEGTPSPGASRTTRKRSSAGRPSAASTPSSV